MTPLNSFLAGLFRRLGLIAARNASHMLILSVLTALLMATGLQRIAFVQDLEHLFVPTHSRGMQERSQIETLFNTEEQKMFFPGHEAQPPTALQLYIVDDDDSSSNNTRNLLTVDKWSDIVALHKFITGFRVVDDGRSFNFSSIRAKMSYDVNEFVSVLNSLMEKLEKGESNLMSYPLMRNPVHFNTWFLPQSFGDVQLDASGHVKRAGVVKLIYYLDASMTRATQQWQAAIHSYNLSQVISENSSLRWHVLTSTSLETELSSNINSSLFLFPLAILVILIFTVASTRSILGILGLLTSSLATIAAWGLLIYVTGEPWQAINLAAIFVLLGVGLDDTFVLITAWKKHAEVNNTEERLALAFGDAGPSITLTSVTNLVSVGIGAFMPGFRAVQLFCRYVFVAFLALYVFTFACFGPLLIVQESTFNSKIEAFLRNKHRNVNGGNTSGEGDNNAEGEREDEGNIGGAWLTLSSYLSRPLIKTIILVFYIIYLSASIYSISTKLKEGLERRNLCRDDSYVLTAMEVEDAFFRDYPYRIQIVFDDYKNYSNPTVQRSVNNVLDAFRASQYIRSDNKDLEELWLDEFLLNLELSGILELDEATFTAELENFISSTNLLKDNVVINANSSKVISSRFVLQSNPILNAREEVDMVKELRTIADKYNVTVYHYFFPFFDQFVDVRPLSITTVGACCFVTMLVSLLFLFPSLISTLSVSLVVLSIEVGVVGFMALMGVRLDVVALVCLVVCVGLSVDFAAHVALHFVNEDNLLNKKGENGAKQKDHVDPRIAHSLESFGPPIMEAAVSTLLAVTLLILQPSYILRSFAKMMVLVVVFSVVHALVVLPVVFSLLLPLKNNKNAKTQGENEEQERMVEVEMEQQK